MSFDRLSSLEAQPTTFRRGDDPEYQDDPAFNRATEALSTQLFTLTSNISHLSNQIALLGTRRDTERVRERVHDLLDETRDGFKEVGEGVKKVQAWEDVNVRSRLRLLRSDSERLTSFYSPRKNTRNRKSPVNSKPRWTSFKPSSAAPSKNNAQPRPPPALPSMKPNLLLRPNTPNNNSNSSNNKTFTSHRSPRLISKIP